MTEEEVATASNTELLAALMEAIQEHPPKNMQDADRVVRAIIAAKRLAAQELQAELGK